MRSLILFALAVVLVAGVVAAQPHPNGYAAGLINFNKTAKDPTVVILDSAGKVLSSIGTGLNNVHGLVMDHKNELLIVTNLDGKIYKVDPKTGTNLGTLFDFGSVISIRDIAVDQNGDYFFGTTSSGDAVYGIDSAGGSLRTLHTFGAGWDPGEGGINININTGELLVLGDGSGDNLWEFMRDGSGFTTIASSMVTRYGHCQHIPTGDIYSGTGGNNFLMKLAAGTSKPTTFMALKNAENAYCVKADRASAATQTLVGGLWWSSSNPAIGQGVWLIDIAAKTGTTLNGALNSSVYEVEILYRRNVHSYQTGKGKWDIGIHIPEDAKKVYLLAVGASGVRPGIPFPSGRRAALNPDAITFLGLLVGLAPYVTPTSGTLDANGKATCKLDVSGLGSAANGTLLWFMVLTLDGAAPEGVKTFTDPHIVKIEGM